MIKIFLKKIHLFNLIKYIYLYLIKLKNKVRNFLFPTAIILTYHRVAKTIYDPHQIAVNPENFRAHLTYLKQNYQIISLTQLIREVKNKTLKRKMVAITFDDGYTDNLQNALPILEDLEIPATIFVSSGHIDKQSFYWDIDTFSENNRPMTQDELVAITNNPLISIGGHTLSHPHIPNLDKDQKKHEISEDRKKLSKFCCRDINLFAFPFGEFDDESVKIAKDAGYSCTCILKEQRVMNNTNVFKLPRFLVRDWNSKKFIKKMRHEFL